MGELRSPLAAVLELHADQQAIIGPSEIWSWSDVAQRVQRLAATLERDGITTGSRIANTDDNSPDFLIALMALLEVGAVACPISGRLPRVEQAKLIESLSAREFAVSVDEWSSVPNKSLRPLTIELPRDRVAAIVATSGSVDTPKMAALTVGNMHFNALGSHENIPFAAGDRWLVSLPLYHVGGMALMYRALLHGGTLVIPDREKSLPEAIRDFQITHLSVVPTQLYRLLSEPRGLIATKPHLKAILVGGGPTPPALTDRALEIGLPIHMSYGLTEMGSQVTTTSTGDSATALFTSGRALKYRGVNISPDGEILVRGETRFAGYVVGNDLVRPFDADGWFATGDMGAVDSQGYLTVHGRKDNMFVSGGENIHPEEIESALSRMPEVREVVVVAIDDDEFGHRPVGFVRLDETVPFDEVKLVAFLERFLPRFKIPDEFFPWPDDAPVDRMKPDRRWFTRRAVDILNR